MAPSPKAAAAATADNTQRKARRTHEQNVRPPPYPSPVLPQYYTDDDNDLLDEKWSRQITQAAPGEVQRWRHEALLPPPTTANTTASKASLAQPRCRRKVRAVTAALLALSTAVLVVLLGRGVAGETTGTLCPTAFQRFRTQQDQHWSRIQELEGENLLEMAEAEVYTGSQGGESYLENRPTREATFKPRKIADLPAHYLPGYCGELPTLHNTTYKSHTSDDASPPSAAGKPHHPPWAPGRPRLIVIGDVHGELEFLQELLAKIDYHPRAQGGRDHVVLAGDIINKGPDTPGVLDLAMQEGFSGVRGNHDDYLLRLFAKHGDEKKEVKKGKAVLVEEEEEETSSVSGTTTDDEENGDELDEDVEDEDEQDQGLIAVLGGVGISGQQQQHPLRDRPSDESTLESKTHKKHKKSKPEHKKKQKHIRGKDRRGLAVIRSCTPEQRRWLANLPLILNVGHIPYITSPSTSEVDVARAKPTPTPYRGQVVVVHGGIVPGIPLKKQDPWALLHMRTLLLEKKKQNKKHHKGDKDNKTSKHKSAAAAGTSHSDPENSTDADDDGEREDEDYDEDQTTNFIPLETREGKPWAPVWDNFQRKHYPDEDDRTTVVFGHDAKAGMQKGKYSFGLDTGCVAGGRLTAMVFFEVNESPSTAAGADAATGTARVAHEFVSISCKAAKKELESEVD